MVIKQTKWNNIAVDKQVQHDSAPLAPLQPVLTLVMNWWGEEGLGRERYRGSIKEHYFNNAPASYGENQFIPK